MPDEKDFEPSITALWSCLQAVKEAQACIEIAGLDKEYGEEIRQAGDAIDRTITTMLKAQYSSGTRKPMVVKAIRKLKTKS